MPVSREPGKEMAGATLMVGAVAYLTSVFYFMLPHSPHIHARCAHSAALGFVAGRDLPVAAIGYAQRLHREGAYLDRALFVAAGLNVAVPHHHEPVAARARRRLQTAHSLMVMSYVVVLGGTLLDNAQLFDQVSRLAASDSLTGLANHRRLLEVMETRDSALQAHRPELCRSAFRSGWPEKDQRQVRPFDRQPGHQAAGRGFAQ